MKEWEKKLGMVYVILPDLYYNDDFRKVEMIRLIINKIECDNEEISNVINDIKNIINNNNSFNDLTIITSLEKLNRKITELLIRR